jgi:hypothetical protein
MHTYCTAVLPGTAEATPADTTGAGARDQWLARCTEDAAKALATGNSDLLPLLPCLVFCPDPERCPDCEGTGYTWMGDEFTLCPCMTDETPAYDFPRRTASQARLIIGMTRPQPHRQGRRVGAVPALHYRPDRQRPLLPPLPRPRDPGPVGA